MREVWAHRPGWPSTAATHASTLPAIGVQAPVSTLPRSEYVFEIGSHAVHGVVPDLTRRVLSLPWRG